MSEELKDDTRRKVTAVGNSWIVCKSKSHAGHVYYFNTLTGEAAWNLSDSEIEKAKSRTKHLEHIPGGHPTRCPEPRDKPPTLNSEQTQRELSESLLINTVSEKQSSVTTFSNVANNNTSILNPLNQMSGLTHCASTQITHPSILNHPTISNLNSLNNSVNAFSLNTAPLIYNPKIWAVPFTQQVIMTPTMASVNHTTSPLKVGDSNLSQTMSEISPFQTSLNSFENGNKFTMITGMRSFQPKYQTQGGVRNLNRKPFINKNDLRQKLSAKKRFNVLPSVGPGGSINLRSEVSPQIASTIEGIQTSDSSDGTLENRSMETQLHESSSKVDSSPLKCLAPSDSNSDAWFIVVDLAVLLNEFKFLNILTDSDDGCHLMVPKRVMDELKSYVACTDDIQSRRILRFVSQQIEIGYAFTAEEPSEVKGGTMAEAIYATCTELSKDKYHLILLSNDNELLTHQNPSNIKIFSIDEIKKLLVDNPHKKMVSTVPKKQFMLDGLITKIKITVPNDTLQTIGTTNHKEDIPAAAAGNNKSELNNTQDVMQKSPIFKNTVDAGIQTDFDDISACISKSNVTEQELNPLLTSPHKSKEINKRPISPVLKVVDKKREIKLKRSMSNIPVPPIDGGKKQFKWRRRRNTTPQVVRAAPFECAQNSSSKNVELLQSNAKIDTMSNNDAISGQNGNKIADEDMESVESSIIADHRNSTINENVTIEETSTSGIISNTESNVDDESNYSYSTMNREQIINKKKCNMYEIENMTMEEYLKIKSDEWVSRFIQIMEEALSQVLQQEPSFSHKAMPPPWTLHEASQCIVIKFCDHQDIVEAANKLSDILFHVSDPKGKIAVNMTPFQYMKMYSYGVNLLDTILKVNDNCDDIQIAVEALKKLLDDIKNPNMDAGTNDTFNDNTQEDLINTEVSEYSDNYLSAHDNDSNGVYERELASNHTMVQETPKPSHKKRKLAKEKQTKPVQFIRKIDIESDTASLFFQALRLKKSHCDDKSKFKSNINVCDVPETQHIDLRIEEQNNLQDIDENEKNIVVPSNQPKIVRNFSINPDLEKKIKMFEKFKMNCNSKVYEEHDDDLDYEEDYNEYVPEESESNDMTIPRDENNDSNSPQTIDPLIDDNNKRFKYIMYSLFQEIRSTLCQVKTLCDQCFEGLETPERSTNQKCELRKMAERAQLHIKRLCRSLGRMLDNGTNDSTQSMCNLLRQADIDIGLVDAGLLYEYRTTVAKCKEFADLLSGSIQNIICGFKS